MRIALAAPLLVLAGCISPAKQTAPAAPLAESPVVPCSEPRPELCTMQYDPACGSLAAGGFRTYSSACNACADPEVAGYQQGSCSE